MVLAHRHGGLGAVKEAGERAIRVQPLSKSGCHLYTKWRPSGLPPTDTWNPKEGWPPARYVRFASLCIALLCFALLFLAQFCFPIPPFLCCSCPGFASDCFAFSFLKMFCFSLCYIPLLCFDLLSFPFPGHASSCFIRPCFPWFSFGL